MDNITDAEEITPEMARKELERRKVILSNKETKSSDEQKLKHDEQLKRLRVNFGIDRNPISNIQDLGAGLMRGSQNIAALLGEGGQQLASLLTGGNAPKVNIREELGLTDKNPVDLSSVLSSKNPNQALVTSGQYAPAMLSGGTSLPGQAASMGLYSATQVPEGERLKEALKNSTLTYAGGKVMQAIPGVFNLAKKVIDWLRPGKASEEFLRHLLSVPKNESLPTDIENIKELSKRMSFARNSAEGEALIPKEELMSTEGKTSIFPSQKRGNELSDEISKILSNKPGEIAPEDMSVLQKTIKSYFNTGELDPLHDVAADILNVDELPQSKINKINSLLEMEPLRNGKYLNLKDVDKNYKTLGLDEAHNRFKENPTFKNSDELKKLIGREKRRIEDRISRNPTSSDEIKLRRLERNERTLLSDQERFFETLSPEKQELYRHFRTKWAENIPKYVKSGNTIRSLSEGNAEGLSRSEISSSFKGELSKHIEDILKDIGSSGVNNIIYNKLLLDNPKNAKALADAIISSRRTGGYYRYITKEHESFANELIKRLKHQTAAKYIVGALGGGIIGGTGYEIGKRLI
jgi:hypothetical protein